MSVLVRSNLVIPRLRGPTVTRARLHQRLDATATAAVTLVSAPSGYGKTVAVASWLRDRDVLAAWVTLDGHDNDPVLLWTYVVTAVTECLGIEPIEVGHHPDLAIEALAAALRADRRRLIIVLDDVETVTRLATITHAVRALPINARLILIARSLPALPLPRLRAGRQLAEVRAQELAFTLEEARELLEVAEGLTLGADEIRTVVEQTEGWAAALHLAALRLRTDHAPLAGFNGRHRFVASYLAGEVVDRLEPELRAFLEETSVLPRISAELADHVRERTDSRHLLHCAVHENLFLVPLDEEGEWFRYHALFAEYLQSRVAHRGSLRVRAAEWFRDHDQIEDAVELAIAADDQALVASLLEEHHLELSRSGRSATVEGWIAALPRDLLAARPGVLAAGVLAASGSAIERDAARRLLALAGLAKTADPDRWTPYHEAARLLLSAVYGDDCVPAAAAAAEQALALARTHATELLVPAMAARAYTLLLLGAPREADALADAALVEVAAGDSPYGRVGALATRALVAAGERRPTVADAFAERALQEAARAHITTNLATTLAHFATAQAALQLGDPARAERSLRRALAIRATLEGGALHAWLTAALAEVHAARGRLTRAERALDEARELLAGCTDPGCVAAHVAVAAATVDRVRASAEPPREPLSNAELAVLRRFDDDRSTAEIAADLYLSRNTVKTHIRSIYRKLGVASRADALARAEALGLLASPG